MKDVYSLTLIRELNKRRKSMAESGLLYGCPMALIYNQEDQPIINRAFYATVHNSPEIIDFQITKFYTYDSVEIGNVYFMPARTLNGWLAYGLLSLEAINDTFSFFVGKVNFLTPIKNKAPIRGLVN